MSAKTFLLLLVCMIVFGCTVDLEDSRSLEVKDRAFLVQSFARVEGLYRGELVGNDGEMNTIELGIFTSEVQDGFNSNGELKFKPQLRARYLNLEELDLNGEILLDGTFFNETGEVIFSNPPHLSINGRFLADQIEARVTNSQGILGNVVLKRVARLARAPASDLTVDFEKIIGLYKGTLTLPDGQVLPFELGVYQLEEIRGESLQRNLFAQLRNSDGLDELGDIIFRGQYFRDSQGLSFSSVSRFSEYEDTLSSETFSLRSQIEGFSKIRGELSRGQGVVGKLEVEKVAPIFSAPASGLQAERIRRLLALYSKITGVYTGGWQLRSESKTVPVEMEIFISYEPRDGLTLLPILKARLTRKDLSTIVAIYAFDAVNFFPSTGKLLGRSTYTVPPNPVGGARIINDAMAFESVVQGRRLYGRLTNAIGDAGVLNLDRSVERP